MQRPKSPIPAVGSHRKQPKKKNRKQKTIVGGHNGRSPENATRGDRKAAVLRLLARRFRGRRTRPSPPAASEAKHKHRSLDSISRTKPYRLQVLLIALFHYCVSISWWAVGNNRKRTFEDRDRGPGSRRDVALAEIRKNGAWRVFISFRSRGVDVGVAFFA